MLALGGEGLCMHHEVMAHDSFLKVMLQTLGLQESKSRPTPLSKHSKAQVVSHNLQKLREGGASVPQSGSSPCWWKTRESMVSMDTPPLPRQKKGPPCARDLTWPLSKTRVHFRKLQVTPEPSTSIPPRACQEMSANGGLGSCSQSHFLDNCIFFLFWP